MKVNEIAGDYMNLTQADVGIEYVIRSVNVEDEELESFLFSLGCYEGEKITVVSIRKKIYVVSIKDARYSIDNRLAEAILV